MMTTSSHFPISKHKMALSMFQFVDMKKSSGHTPLFLTNPHNTLLWSFLSVGTYNCTKITNSLYLNLYILSSF